MLVWVVIRDVVDEGDKSASERKRKCLNLFRVRGLGRRMKKLDKRDVRAVDGRWLRIYWWYS